MGDTTPNPVVLRVRLGEALKQLAADAHKTPAEVATYIGVSTSTVSRIYNGRQAVSIAQVRALAALCGVDQDRTDQLVQRVEYASRPAWWSEFGETVPVWMRTLLGLEGAADEIGTYQAQLVPGLMQTPDYVAAVTRRSRPKATAEQIARAVRFRLARQQHARPRRTRIVLDEAVLCRPIGGREVWREQLERLVHVGDQPGTTIQVLPFATGEHPVMGTSFKVMRFDSDPGLDTVYLENDRRGGLLKHAAEIRRYMDAFAELTAEAAGPDESRAMLVTLVKHL